MKHSNNNKAFTLIELLVVIGIIALLAALVFPAIGGALKKAQKATAQADVNSIEGALMLFFDEYRRYPIAGGQSTEGDDYAIEKEMVEILIGKRLSYSSDKWTESALSVGDAALIQNPKKIKFLDIPEDSLATPDTESDTHPNAKPSLGSYVDPWGNMYKYSCDWDYNNFVSAKDTGTQPKSVLAWSRGADGLDHNTEGRLDDPRSWGEDN